MPPICFFKIVQCERKGRSVVLGFSGMRVNSCFHVCDVKASTVCLALFRIRLKTTCASAEPGDFLLVPTNFQPFLVQTVVRADLSEPPVTCAVSCNRWVSPNSGIGVVFERSMQLRGVALSRQRCSSRKLEGYSFEVSSAASLQFREKQLLLQAVRRCLGGILHKVEFWSGDALR